MTTPYPQHFKLFDENVKEVRNLLDIHRKVAKKTPGRKYNVEVLNKSGVVLLVACWESYVEHLRILHSASCWIIRRTPPIFQ